jgi:hypothetical protein
VRSGNGPQDHRLGRVWLMAGPIAPLPFQSSPFSSSKRNSSADVRLLPLMEVHPDALTHAHIRQHFPYRRVRGRALWYHCLLSPFHTSLQSASLRACSVFYRPGKSSGRMIPCQKVPSSAGVAAGDLGFLTFGASPPVDRLSG